MAGATTMQVAPAQEAGRPQPQTTVQPPGGPFVRHTHPGRRQMYDTSGNALGGLITQPLVSTPGYLRMFRLKFIASGGSGTTTVTAAADAPESAVSLVTLRDAFGTPLLVGPGFEILRMVPKFSGEFGLFALSDTHNLPSFSAVATGASASGNFTFATALPLEFAKGLGTVSGANAALLPTLQFQLAASSAVFGVAPNTALPTLEVVNEADFYWLPEGVQIEPPGLGSTCQWVLQNANPTIPSAGTTAVSLPRLGGYLTNLILILRDSTGARIDQYGSRMRIYVDGVALVDTVLSTWQDDMQIVYAGTGASAAGASNWVRDTGVMALPRKRSLNQMSLGLLDTGEELISTNPGTLVQVEASPWGTIANAPAALSCILGQIVPAGSLVMGLPEL